MILTTAAGRVLRKLSLACLRALRGPSLPWNNRPSRQLSIRPMVIVFSVIVQLVCLFGASICQDGGHMLDRLTDTLVPFNVGGFICRWKHTRWHEALWWVTGPAFLFFAVMN